jgi:hypothetical protein
MFLVLCFPSHNIVISFWVPMLCFLSALTVSKFDLPLNTHTHTRITTTAPLHAKHCCLCRYTRKCLFLVTICFKHVSFSYCWVPPFIDWMLLAERHSIQQWSSDGRQFAGDARVNLQSCSCYVWGLDWGPPKRTQTHNHKNVLH